MVNTVLPLYLLFALRLAPVQFGLIDGLYQGGAVLVRAASGFVSDRRRDPKGVAAVGYGLSAVCKIGFLVITTPFAALAGLVMVDRLGKGIRTAPRDALISQSTEPENLGIAFGVHRALDTAGAMIGPLLAFLILSVASQGYDAIFMVSFCFALCGLALLILFVRNPPEPNDEDSRPKVTGRDVATLLKAPGFAGILGIGAALSVATVSDSFLYLSLQEQLQFNMSLFPLLYVVTAVVFMVLAIPFGRVADRIGRTPMFVGGYVVLAFAYVSLLVPTALPFQFVLTLILLGAYYAMTDGVLAALASSLLPENVRGSGLGVLSTATGAGRLVASVLFGVIWTAVGLHAAVAIYLVGLVVVLVVTALLLRTRQALANA
jgi:MFS family permease